MGLVNQMGAYLYVHEKAFAQRIRVRCDGMRMPIPKRLVD